MRSCKKLREQYKKDPEGALLLTDKEIEEATDEICNFINYSSGFDGAPRYVIGLSGGVDSSLTAYLYKEARNFAIGLRGLIMPSSSNTSKDIKYAKEVAENLGMDYEIINILHETRIR